MMKLLLVEDDRDLSRAVKTILEFSSYIVETAFDGEEGLQKATCAHYDLLIVDIMMPRLNGIGLTKRLRAAGDRTPILLLTARAELDDKVNGLDAGADDYLTKPFQAKELLARIRALLRRADQVPELHAIGNMTLLGATSTLEGPKGSVPLTATEFKLCDTLIRNKDIKLSTERIMDLVWDYDTQAEINVVWAYLSSLRKKMEAVGANVVIKAFRGIGYQMVIVEE